MSKIIDRMEHKPNMKSYQRGGMHLLTMVVSCVLCPLVLQQLPKISVLHMSSPINVMFGFSTITNSLYIPDMIWITCLLELMSSTTEMVVSMALKLPLPSHLLVLSSCLCSFLKLLWDLLS
jgi:xanthine/uracil permease